MIKPSVIDGLKRYVEVGCPTGDFLRSVLQNKLLEAFQYADDENLVTMHEIVRYVYNEVPSPAWGSPEKVQKWIQIHAQAREEGVRDEDLCKWVIEHLTAKPESVVADKKNFPVPEVNH